jgi:hypothetical protein
MGLEAGTYINDLVATNPVGASDPKSQGDDHIRLIKAAVQATLPGMAGVVWRSQAKSGNYTVVITDNMTLFDCSAALTLSFTAGATLGASMFVVYARGGNVTLDPNGSETVNGSTTLVVPSGSAALVISTGVATREFYAYSLPLSGSASAQTILRGYIDGLTLSTAGASTTMSIAAGQATDTTSASMMSLNSALAKTTASWVVGNAQGGLDTGSIAANTWYHFFLIQRPDTGVVDVLFSTSASAPTMPTNYTLKRRIGSGKTNGSSQWTSFVQDGDYFRWVTSVGDVNNGAPGTGANTATLTVPTGVNVIAHFNGIIQGNDATQNFVYFSDLSASDDAPSQTAVPYYNGGFLAGNASSAASGGQYFIRTNTSAQVRYRVIQTATTCTVKIATLGWSDQRGANA